jgi:hypothetical protein
MPLNHQVEINFFPFTMIVIFRRPTDAAAPQKGGRTADRLARMNRVCMEVATDGG